MRWFPREGGEHAWHQHGNALSEGRTEKQEVAGNCESSDVAALRPLPHLISCVWCRSESDLPLFATRRVGSALPLVSREFRHSRPSFPAEVSRLPGGSCRSPSSSRPELSPWWRASWPER